MSDGELDKQKLKGDFSCLVANGRWLFLKGENQKAADSFASALALNPDDKNCFVGRSKCFLKMGHFDQALKDAEASLKGDTTFSEGLYMKAEVLYHMAEFEFALVFYHKGLKLRPQVQEFRLGIQKAQEAIENSIGSPSSVKLEIEGDLAFFRQDEVKRSNLISAIENLIKEKKQQSQKTPKKEKTSRKMMGEFYSDRKYLESLMKDEDLVKGKTKGGEQLEEVIQGCLSYLDTCTNFWKEESPICAREKNRKQQNLGKPRHGAPSEHAQFLLKSLDKIDADLECGNAQGSLKKVTEVMKVVQKWSDKEVPDKSEILGGLHSCMGNALFDLGDVDKALEHHHKDLELAERCKVPEAISRALDNIGWVYAQTGQFEQAAEFWEKQLPLVRGALEKTCLFHGLGCCYLMLDRHEEARDFGLRSAAAADEAADEKWQMNANVLVAQSELKLGNFESSAFYFERALTQAKLEEDNFAMNAVRKALEEAKQQLPQ
ncbi:outer dynein arm-docking complex subunit 4 isoform X1 [Acanthochromis polyacanthus]|uniref:outer dynein arm-docking complex subunit 4 isoform X1 n=1 Tax=Acanthochromis polyacanthus TaxID=80966 RepID=UPI002234009E|nr:outer dynein arm-docking complex subunit 4 isoform X1 [Acanthochromis polyacanthus]